MYLQWRLVEERSNNVNILIMIKVDFYIVNFVCDKSYLLFKNETISTLINSKDKSRNKWYFT